MPTFADGDVLSASQLNNLVARLNALTSTAAAANVAFPQIVLTQSEGNAYVNLIHAQDWLHVRLDLPNDDVELTIYYGETEVGTIDGDVQTGYQAQSIDLSGFELTKGAWYRLWLRRREEGGDSAPVTVYYVGESQDEL